MTKLRGALIGCGNIAEFHLRGWARIGEAEIVALVDPRRDVAAQRQRDFAPAARLYEDVDALLAAERVDFVDIATPAALHHDHCLQACTAGLHVICQKPLCDELAAARAVVATFAASDRVLCVHENHIYRPWFRQVLALQRRQSFGPLRLVRLEEHVPAPPLPQFCRSPRGQLLDYGVHLADMVRVLLGVPQRVTARLHRLHPAARGETFAHASFEYPHATAHIEIAWKPGGFEKAGAHVLGDRGEALYEGSMIRNGKARLRVASAGATLVDEMRDAVAEYDESFYAFQRDFVACLRHGRPPPQPAHENIQTLQMIFAAYAAAEQGRAVDFAAFAAPMIQV